MREVQEELRSEKKDTVKSENGSGGEHTVDGVREGVEQVWARCCSLVFGYRTDKWL